MALGLGAVLKAKQKLVEKVDQSAVDEKAWLNAVADDTKMFNLIQQLWLALQHFGEACLRTGVELICDRKTRKIALIAGLTDDNKGTLKEAVRDKIQIVFAQLNKTQANKASSSASERVDERLLKELAELRERARVAEENVARLTSQLVEAEKHLQTAQQDLQTRMQELREAQMQNETLLAQVNTLAADLASAQDRAVQLEKQKQILEGEKQVLEKEKSQLEEKVTSLKERIDQLEQDIQAFPS